MAEICRLSQKIAREGVLWNEIPDPPALVRRRLGPLAVVAEAKGRVVGYAWGVVRPGRLYRSAFFRKTERVVELDAVIVGKRRRGSGIGTALVRAILREARRRGLKRFYVYTASKDLARALGFYRRAGFRTWCATLFI